MDIQALYAYLQGLGSPLLLQASDSNLPAEFRAFLETIPGRQITIYTGNDGLQLQGSIMTIEGGCKDTNWPVQGLYQVTTAIGSARITVNAEESPAAIFGVTQGTLPFDNTNVVAVTVSSQTSVAFPWQITLAENAPDLSPLEVILFGNMHAFPFMIPAGMDFLNTALTVDKQRYSITFYPNSDLESITTFTLNAPTATWNPVPGIFAFDGLDIAANVKTNSFSVVLIGHLMIGGTGVDVGIGMSAGPHWYLYLQPTPPATAFPGLADLATWIGGETLNNSVSEGFSSVDISTVGFDAAITYISATIDVSKFSLDSLLIKSILAIGALRLDVSVALPQLRINGGLHNQEPLSVADLLTSLSLPAATVPDDLQIATANFVADLTYSIYSIELAVENIWTAGPFSFDAVRLSLQYNSAGQGLSGAFRCQFTLVETAVVVLNAEYENADTGWVFAGGLEPGTTLAIGDIIDMLADEFDITSVPEPIKSLVMTKLWVTYASAKNNFLFTCSGTFTVDDKPVSMSITIKIDAVTASANNEGGGYHAYFGGTITIDHYVFNLVFDTTNMETNSFIASFHNSEESNVALKELVAGVSDTVAEFIPTSLVIDLEEVKFIYFKQATKSQFAFGLQFSASVDLNNLPVIGDKLPEGLTMGIDSLQVLFANADFSAAQVAIINPLLPEGITPLLPEGVPKGLIISGNLNIVGYLLPINSGTQKQAAEPVSNSVSFTGSLDTSANDAVAPSDITWFNVQKQLGPMKFQRIGVAFASNVLSFALDAELTLGPASLTMQGLTVGSPLTSFSPVFGIQGFFMDLQTSALVLGGGFLRAKTPDGATAYYGAVMARIGSFSLQALGGDVPAHEADDPQHPGQKIRIPASFFIYANIEAPIGGPPYLYINGFAGGFGINNLLKLPTLDNLPGYILLPGPGSEAPEAGSSPEATINNVLPQMQRYFIPQPGQYWMAAGIAFSSFEMINAFALVTVSFGVDFQVALLGTCSMNFPTGAASPIAYVEIDIMASYSTATGRLAVEGILSPASYVFGSFCRVSGGFAFYIWINPPAATGDAEVAKAGDFVVTLGGYHPAFVPPAYYPRVSRLGIHFGLGPFQVIGQCYFALTPGMFMAGGSLNATWNLDVVQAWFTLGCDFLIAWAPFHYEATVYVSMGCSVNLGLFTLNVSVGADVALWGPPFGGVAHVDLDVISFTISFGDDRTLPDPVTWTSFRDQFLPADTAGTQPVAKADVHAAAVQTGSQTTNILKATVGRGLNRSQVDGQDWILDPDRFSIQLSSAIPTNVPLWATAERSYKTLTNDPALYNAVPPPVDSAQWPYLVFSDVRNQMSATEIWNPVVNIKPMNLNGVDAVLSVAMVRMDNEGNFTNYVTSLTLRPVVGDVPAALWQAGGKSKPSLNDPTFLTSALSGFVITPLPRMPNVVNEMLLIQLLYQQGNRYYVNDQRQSVNPDYQVAAHGADSDIWTIAVSGAHETTLVNNDYILSSLADTWVTDQRNALLANLIQVGFDTYDEAELTTFSTQTALTDWPDAMLLADTLPSA